ncbi:MAG: DUF4239 domain-containing protein [Gemmatimonadetes bacterium]|nr:MAG: DUF4239 domain-containing protein [Gemmatimonadota bacterium]
MFVALLIFLELGRRLGVRRLNVPGARAGVGVVDGSVYALVALMIGFTFNGAAARFDSRRELVGATTNVAGTTWQRIDMLPAELQPPVRDAMRRYIDALIASYASTSVADAATIRQPEAVTRAQNDLWAKAVEVCSTPAGDKARMLLLPSMNELFGAVEKERLARAIHPPRLIYVLLAIAALIGAVFVGYAIATAEKRNWLYMVGVAGTIASATYVVAELEYPRMGRVRVDAIDRTLVDLRESMK